MNFNFIASDKFEVYDLQDLNQFVENYSDFQTVTLYDERELELFLELIGIDNYSVYSVTSPEFSKYWDLSKEKFPEFDEEQFDQFYNNWISKSHRENTMDEYGSLIFLRGISSIWNKLQYRIIVREK